MDIYSAIAHLLKHLASSKRHEILASEFILGRWYCLCGAGHGVNSIGQRF